VARNRKRSALFIALLHKLDRQYNVTRNHTCETIDERMEEVHAYLVARNRKAAARRRRKAA